MNRLHCTDAEISCRGRCSQNKVMSTLRCHCDPYCESFKDCCADFDTFCRGTVTQVKLKKKWSCHNINITNNDSIDLWMIDHCPANTSDLALLAQCKNSTSKPVSLSNNSNSLPVFDEKGDLYKNRFCALCNGVDRNDLNILKLKNECNFTQPRNVSFTHQISSCLDYRLYTNGKHQVRKCLKAKETCSIQHHHDQKACESKPSRIVSIFFSHFKNIYCARCNFRNFKARYAVCGPANAFAIDEPFSITVSLECIMGFDNNIDMARGVTATCPKGQVYDIFLNTCRNSLQFPLINSKKYSITVWLQMSNKRSNFTELINYSSFIDSFSRFLGVNTELVRILESHEIKQNLLVVNLDLHYFHLNGGINVTKEKPVVHQENLFRLTNFTQPINLYVANDTVEIINATVKRLVCASIEYFNREDYMKLPHSRSVYINKTRELLSEMEYFVNNILLQTGKPAPVGMIAVCRQHVVDNCANGTYITLQEHEYVMLPNKSVYRNVSDTVYNEQDYSILNGSVVVCSHFSNEYKKDTKIETKHNIALVILTCIGLSLSVICLFATLVTYSLFAELRTLPGINLMNLSSALLVAHLFWLIGSGQTESNKMCSVTAAILHFAFLASFAWMSLIAFSTWKLFSAKSINVSMSSDKEFRRKKITRALAIGWLPVLFFVALCILLDQFDVVSIRYGGTKGCWINNSRTNLYVFVLPISLAILWNGVFFGMAVKVIHKAKQQTRILSENRGNQSNYLVYLKIAVLMGFTWIFGVLGSFVHEYFMYPFVALNTMQGVYIAVSFAFTHRVVSLYKLLFRKSNEEANTRSTLALTTSRTMNTTTDLDTRL